MSEVFILQDDPGSPKNFLPAERFGKLVILFNNHISLHSLPRHVGALRDKMRAATKEDWIIPVGNPGLIMAAGKVFHDLTGQINLLVWDRQAGRYVGFRMKDDCTEKVD